MGEAKANIVADDVMEPLLSTDEEDRANDALEAKANTIADEVMDPLISSDEDDRVNDALEAKANTIADEVMEPLPSSDEEDRVNDALEAKANVVADDVMEPLSSSDEEEYNDAPPNPPPAVNVASSIPVSDPSTLTSANTPRADLFSPMDDEDDEEGYSQESMSTSSDSDESEDEPDSDGDGQSLKSIQEQMELWHEQLRMKFSRPHKDLSSLPNTFDAFALITSTERLIRNIEERKHQ